MDVQKTDKAVDRNDCNGKEDMNDNPPPSPLARKVKLAGVQLKIVGESLSIIQDFKDSLDLLCVAEGETCRVTFSKGEETVFEVLVRTASNVYQAGSTLVFLRVSQGSAVISTRSQNDVSQLLNYLHSHVAGGQKKLSRQSVFSLRTEEGSAKQYFQFYGFLSQQQNMMLDYTRTATYQSAMLQNPADFHNKVVLDVGAGTGILSFFAVEAGAKKVYSVEASSMSVHCQQLVKDNNMTNKVTVIAGKIEEIDLPEKVDVIISEPMGYMLYNERMLETFLHAKKWLKPGGKMYPSQGSLYVAPFNDEQLYLEQCTKAFFWSHTSFYGIDLSGLRQAALEEYFRQPILDTFDVRIVMAKPVGHLTDFTKAKESDLHKVTIPFTFSLWSSGMVHGLAFWFDVAFCGSQMMVWLSTGPMEPLTHWYQIRCLFSRPMFARAGQELTGTVVLTANERQSYDVDIEAALSGEGVKFTGSYDLKNPNFRYMTMPPPPPGSHNTSPTQEYFEPGSNGPYSQTAQQHVGVVPQPHQLVAPASAGGTVVVSAMTPHPVMAVNVHHTAPPGVNGVTLMNGGLLSPGHTPNKTSNSNVPSHQQGVHLHSQPLLRSPPPGHTHSQSSHGSRGILQPVVGGAYHQQYVYASTATAVDTMRNPRYMYKFHQVHPNLGAGQGGHTHSTY